MTKIVKGIKGVTCIMVRSYPTCKIIEEAYSFLFGLYILLNVKLENTVCLDECGLHSLMLVVCTQQYQLSEQSLGTMKPLAKVKLEKMETGFFQEVCGPN